MDADLDTLATALYVTIDDLLQQQPELAPRRPRVGILPKLSDAELVTLAVMQALLGFTSEARWLRHAGRHLRHLFPYLPGQSGYNKRLRRTGELLRCTIRVIACDTTLWSDNVWVVDSTPPASCASRPRAAPRRSPSTPTRRSPVTCRSPPFPESTMRHPSMLAARPDGNRFPPARRSRVGNVVGAVLSESQIDASP